jgi:chromosome segregation ATPase
MIDSLRQQRSARSAPTLASIRNRPIPFPEPRDDAPESTRDARDESTFKLPVLEAEVRALRQNLAEVTADRNALRKEMDELRCDRDHWRKLAERGEPKSAAAQKTWFCGRASGDA